MRLGSTRAVALQGMLGQVVEVEAHLAFGLPAFTLVGSADRSLGEARERVRAAIASCGITFPPMRVTVNLWPAALPKSGSAFDLAIAVAVLAGAGIAPGVPRGAVHLGELGLDGRLHPVRGLLPMVHAAARAGVRTVVVPEADVAEAALVPGVTVIGIACLAELAVRYGAEIDVPPVAAVEREHHEPRAWAEADMADVVGQEQARFALEVAAAGGHHLLMVGPPGTQPKQSMLVSVGS